MFRKRKFLWYIDGSHMCNILIGSILKSIFDPNVMIFYHNYAGDAQIVFRKLYQNKENLTKRSLVTPLPWICHGLV